MRCRRDGSIQLASLTVGKGSALHGLKAKPGAHFLAPKVFQCIFVCANIHKYHSGDNTTMYTLYFHVSYIIVLI